MEWKDTTETEKELVSFSQSSPKSKTIVASQSKASIAKNSEKLKEQKFVCVFREDPGEKHMILCVECQT